MERTEKIALVCGLIEDDYTISQAAGQVGVSASTVSRWLVSHGGARALRAERQAARTREAIPEIRRRFSERHQTIGQIAAELDISEATVTEIIGRTILEAEGG